MSIKSIHICTGGPFFTGSALGGKKGWSGSCICCGKSCGPQCVSWAHRPWPTSMQTMFVRLTQHSHSPVSFRRCCHGVLHTLAAAADDDAEISYLRLIRVYYKIIIEHSSKTRFSSFPYHSHIIPITPVEVAPISHQQKCNTSIHC